MIFIQLLFWLAVAIVFYSYVGYGLVLYFLVRIRGFFKGKRIVPVPTDWPSVTLLVAAYNEEHDIENKVRNSLALIYPPEKIKFLFVTDGSTDQTPNIVRKFSEVTLLHSADRKGKMAAVDRAMAQVDTDVVVFTDANTMLNPEAAKNIARHFLDSKVGAVAGEKQVISNSEDSAAGAGEGFYWKYENTLKRWDSELYSVVGAAGELFSVRTKLYFPVPKDTIIEDFYMTLKIAEQGYRVVYEPQAIAQELPSAGTDEELKRKVRIAAGGLQAISRLSPLLNFFRYGVLSFQYVSHRVLRWTLAPLSLLFIFIANLVLAANGSLLYQLIFGLQLCFYLAAGIGYLLQKRKLKIKAFFIPYYFLMMNYAVYAGFFRLIKGKQSAVWERSKRQISIN